MDLLELASWATLVVIAGAGLRPTARYITGLFAKKMLYHSQAKPIGFWASTRKPKPRFVGK